jgi:hypothetical protein
MMNLVDLQDKLKNFSEEQLISQMQAPTGEVPQFLLLSEITRRQKMRDSFAQAQGQEQSTVAQDAIATAGLPQDAAQQLAGSMAPQTNMAGNDGAMGGQPVMPPAQPQPPMGMAGGGIVALQEGGRVQRQPRLVVSGGRQFIEMPDGSLIPPEMLGFGESDMAGAGMADLAQPQPMDRSFGANPSYREDGAQLSTAPAMPQLDFLQPRLPEADPRPMAPAPIGGAAMPRAAGISQPFDLEMAPLADEFTTMPPMAPESISGAPATPSPARGSGRSPRETPTTVDPMVAMQNFLSGDGAPTPSGRGPRETPQTQTLGEGLMGLLPERTAAGAGRGRTPRPESEVSVPPEAVPSAEDALAATPPVSPDGEPMPPLPGPIETSPQGVAAMGGPGGAGGGAGGIAGLAGAAGAAPTDFEQELLSMLAAREKRAEQDKWLSLAQFGLQLMSSNQPNIGAAIGEAGGPALDALRSSRESYDADRLGLLGTLEQSRLGREQLALQRQAAAARATGGGGRAPGFTPNQSATQLRASAEMVQKNIDRMTGGADPSMVLQGLIASGDNAAATRLQQEMARAKMLSDMATNAAIQYSFGAPLTGGSDDGVFDATQ